MLGTPSAGVEDSRDTATVYACAGTGGVCSDIAYDAISQAICWLKAAMRNELDLALPGQSGISLIRELHEHAATPIADSVVPPR